MRQFKPGQLQSGSLYPITASFALTASYLSGSISINTGSLVTTASFNAFTASYTTGSFTGSFKGDGSQLTGIVSSKWTGSNPISRQSDVEIIGSLGVTGSVIEFNMDTFQVKNSSGTTILDVYDSGFIGNDGNGTPAIDTENRDLLDSNGINSIDWDNRQLYQSDGATITLDWETGALTGSLQGTASFASTASYVNPLRQQILLSGSLKLDPTQDPDPTGIDLDSTVLFQSSSNTVLGYDLYVRQNGNLVKWKWIEGILETGLLYGGVVTYSGSNVFVSPGSGIIAEHNATTGSEVSPMVEYVTWNAITQSITNIATQQVTYLYIDNNGVLQQQSTRFTSQQYHSYIPLGAVGHFDYTQVSAFGGGVQTAYDQISQISNFVDAFGPLKMSGYGLTGQAGSLRLSVGSGTSFIHGGFYQNNPEFPSQITTPSQATASLARVQRSGSVIAFDTNAGNLYTVVDPTQYDRDGDGILHSVGSGNWSIQRVFTDPKTGVLYVYYGQARYTSLLNALQYLPTDPFTEGDTFDFTTFVGFLVLKGNASDITNTAVNSIINGGLFRGSGQGSGGGIALSNLDDLTDVSIVSPTNGQALIYNAGIWQNGTPTSASYALTSSFAQSGNGVFSGSFTGSYIGDGAGLYNIPASGIVGLNLSQIVSGSVSASISPQSGLQVNTNVTATSFTGSLFGTASWAQNAVTASYVQTAQTASYVLNAVSASFATSASFAVSASRAVSASFANTASFVTPLNQNVIVTGSLNVTQNITGSRMILSASSNMNSGSTLTVYGSGSTQPVFTVQGSQGELFSVTDSLSGSLFSVNDISGLPILEVFSDNTTLIGNYLDPMLITTAKVTQTNSGSFVLYSLPTASYDTAFFEYSVRSGSNARAGTIMAIQSGSAVNFTETTTTDFGSTSAISFVVVVTGSNMALTGSSSAGSWTIKTIVRGL